MRDIFRSRIILSSASENDLTGFKRECVPSLGGKTIFADKIYRDDAYWKKENETKSNNLLTPIKGIKGATEEEKQRNKAADDMFSSAVSSVREPVEDSAVDLSKKQIFKELTMPVNGRTTFTCDGQSRHRVYNVNF